MNLMKEYIARDKPGYFGSVVFAVLGVLMGTVSYIILADIVAHIIIPGTPPAYLQNRILITVCVLILKELFSAISTALSHKATFNTLKQIRMDISMKLFNMPLGDVINMGSGQLKDILVDQVNSIETTLAHLLPEVTSSILAPVILYVYMFNVDWRLAALSFVPVIAGFAFMAPPMRLAGIMQPKSVEIGKRMNRAIVEYVNGIEVIKAFNQFSGSYKRYEESVYENAEFFYSWMKKNNTFYAVSMSLAPMGILAIIPFGMYFFSQGGISVSELVIIVVLSFGTVSGFMNIAGYADDLAKISLILTDVEKLLGAKELIHGDKAVPISDFNIEFDNVSFAYTEDKNVLENINFNIDAGKVTAFVGPSGSGKSTITKLIAGFWDVKSGQIKIGGTNIKDIPLESLSDVISYVSQDNFLFDISVRDNIRIGKPDATESEVELMAKRAGCDEFIRRLENGYDTIVGEGGGHLSGGERQRIAIARAMIKDAPIVILDEATSYMDPENESIIQEAVSNLVKGKTLILIAHRLRTVTEADRIFVVESGRIQSFGTHKELLAKSVLYQDMWQAAVKGDE